MSGVMRITIAGLILALLSLSVSGQVVKRGTREEAIELVRKVKGMWQTLGPQKTLDAVNKLTHNLRNKDLYPFIGHVDGYIVGHFLQALRGINSLENRDMRGTYIYRDMVKMVKTRRRGWVDYTFPNFITKRVDEKTSYVEALDNEYFVGVGVLKKIKDTDIRNN